MTFASGLITIIRYLGTKLYTEMTLSTIMIIGNFVLGAETNAENILSAIRAAQKA